MYLGIHQNHSWVACNKSPPLSFQMSPCPVNSPAIHLLFPEKENLGKRIKYLKMKRRQAIQNIAVMAGGLLALPSWAKGWNAQTLPEVRGIFDNTDQNMLTQIVEAIIPESGIPGAKSLGVPAFVETMLADCYDWDVQRKVENGLRVAERRAQEHYGQSFTGLPMTDKQALLVSIEQGTDVELKAFYGLVKDLTIQGYTSSEYVQTTYLEYEMAPGNYYGCIPVKQ